MLIVEEYEMGTLPRYEDFESTDMPRTPKAAIKNVTLWKSFLSRGFIFHPPQRYTLDLALLYYFNEAYTNHRIHNTTQKVPRK